MEETKTTVPEKKQEEFLRAAIQAFLSREDTTGARDVFRQLNFRLPDDGAEEAATEQPITAPEGTAAEAITPDLGTLAKILGSDGVLGAYGDDDYSDTGRFILETVVLNVPKDIIAAAMDADGAEKEVCNSLLEGSGDPVSLVNDYVLECSYYGCLFEQLAEAIQNQAQVGEGAPHNGTTIPTGTGTES